MFISKPMLPGGRPLLAIGYNYNTQKFLYFIVTEDARSKKAGITYLSKYSNPFSNVSI